MTEATTLASAATNALNTFLFPQIDANTMLTAADRTALKQTLTNRVQPELDRLTSSLANNGASTFVYARKMEVDAQLAMLQARIKGLPAAQQASLLFSWVGIVSASGPTFSLACTDPATEFGRPVLENYGPTHRRDLPTDSKL